MARSDYCGEDFFRVVMGALTPENRLAVYTSMYTGLRISDVLNLKTDQIRRQRFTVTEQKTGKRRHVRIPDGLVDDLLRIAGKIFVFENRLDYRRHRTRQAVYKDLRRACNLLRVSATLTISPHTARKIYAVNAYRENPNAKKVQQLLNHESEAVTMIYAMADELTRRSHTQKQLQTISAP